MLMKRLDIADNEKVLMFKNKSFVRVLEPGRYTYFDWNNHLTFQTYDITNVIFEHKMDQFLLKSYPVLTEKYIDKYETNDHQVAIISIDGKFNQVLAPASFIAVWKSADVKVDVLDISDTYEINDALLVHMLSQLRKSKFSNTIADHFHYIEVPDKQVGLLTINGQIERILKTGSYGFWKFHRSINVKLIDGRLQTLDVSGQEILTKDRVSLRINLYGNYQVIDPEKAATSVSDYKELLYKELQLELREVVGTQSLDELLADKDAISASLAKSIRQKMTAYGLNVISVGVKDIILPGEMKQILNQVVEAQKQAEANLIKRREETAATRSLHNTAKMMENNPTLMRLKELEALEKVADKIDNISVYNGLEGVMNGLVKLSKA